jgi:hypothetical protein
MGKQFVRTAVLALLLCGVAFGQVGSALPPRTSFGIHAAEVGGGLVGLVVAAGSSAALGYVAVVGNDMHPEMEPAVLVVSAAVGIAGCAGGICLVGSAFHQEGRFWPTFGYGAASFGMGALFLAAGSQVFFPLGWVGAAAIVATPVVATWGYNRSRPRDAFGSRFLPPTIDLTTETRFDHTKVTTTRVELLRLAF